MSKNPVIVINNPKTDKRTTLQTKHVADVTLEGNVVYIFPTHVHVDNICLEAFTWKYATRGQAENVHTSISNAMIKGCSVKIGASGDAMHSGKGS